MHREFNVKRFIAIIVWISAVLTVQASAARLTVVNYSEHPVPATAITVDAGTLSELGIPMGTSIHARIVGSGAEIPAEFGMQDGKPVARFYLALRAREKVELDVESAPGPGITPASVSWNAARNEGVVSNGVISLRFHDNKWDLLFAGSTPEAERLVLCDGGYYGWLDDHRRGRVSDTQVFDPSKDDSRDPGPDGAGMISTRTARIVHSTAEVKPNGDVEVQIEKRFAGYASNVEWTEVYTLAAGLPLLKYSMRFDNRGDTPVYVAYVGRGGWMYARYGAYLENAPRLVSERKDASDVPLGNETLRYYSIHDPMVAGIESDSGVGVALSTLTKIPTKLVQGSMVWQFDAHSLSLPLAEAEQGQYPWLIEKAKPVETGMAFLVTTGDIPVVREGRTLLNSLNAHSDVKPSTPYAVFAGDRVLQVATVNQTVQLSGGSTLGALQVDFAKNYLLNLTLPDPSVITAIPLDGVGSPVTVGQYAAGQVSIDLNAATRWKGVRSLVLRASGQGAMFAALQRKPFDAPEIISPANNAAITDLAFFLKWWPQEDAHGYDIQIARDASFADAKTITVKGVTHYMPEELPPPGRWFWRLRATSSGIAGKWTAARSLTVNSVHGKAPILRPVSVDRPLFTIEAGDNSDFNKLAKFFPDDLKQYFAVVVGDKVNLPQLLAPARVHGIAVMLRTHHPSPVDGWTSLADVEAVFQQFPNVIGIQGGESLDAWYGNSEKSRYVQRLVQLAVKYGRIVHEADGTYDDNRWKALYDDPVAGKMVRENSPYIIFSQKNNIFNKQFMTQSAVLGQYLTGTIGNSGAWEDGGWYWAQVGFRKLGESYGARSGRQQDMPPIFWDLTFLMGLARGATVFSMDGQGGVFMRGEYDPSDPAQQTGVLWSSEGQETIAFQRYVLPFLRAVVTQHLIPTRAQVLRNVKLAVTYEGDETVTKFHEGRYREFWGLYAGTYGFRPQGAASGEVIEYFPNTGRYFYIPILPPGTTLTPKIPSVPIRELQDPTKVRTLFNQYYPNWYAGDALVSITGDTLVVLNSHENEDITETYSIPLDRGILHGIDGKVAVHSYLVGKFEDNNHRLWLQANTNYAERATEIALTCDHNPELSVQPQDAVKSRIWDAAQKKLTLVLSHAAGAVEVNVDISK